MAQKFFASLICLTIPVVISAFFMLTHPDAALTQPIWWVLSMLSAVAAPLLVGLNFVLLTINFVLLTMFSFVVGKSILVSKQAVLPGAPGWGWLCASVSGGLTFLVLTWLFGQIVMHEIFPSSGKSVILLTALAGGVAVPLGFIITLPKAQSVGGPLFVTVAALVILVALLHDIVSLMDSEAKLAEAEAHQVAEQRRLEREQMRERVSTYAADPQDPHAPLYAWLAQNAWDAPNISPDPNELWIGVPALGAEAASIIRCAYPVIEGASTGYWTDFKPQVQDGQRVYHRLDVFKNDVCKVRDEEYRNGR